MTDSSKDASETTQKILGKWLDVAGAVIRAADLGAAALGSKDKAGIASAPSEVIIEGLSKAAKQLEDLKSRDPLLGAAQWFVQAFPDVDVTLLQQRLSIGYNRASRLLEAARASLAAESAKAGASAQAEDEPQAPPAGASGQASSDEAGDHGLDLSALDDLPACAGCGAIAGVCASFPHCHGGQEATEAAVAISQGQDKSQATNQVDPESPACAAPGVHAHLLGGRHVAVEAGVLQLIRNALQTDASNGRTSRKEMLQALDQATFSLSEALPQDVEALARQAEEAHKNVRDMLDRLERLCDRRGQLLAQHQGKSWPQEVSDEFESLRDERIPLLKRDLRNLLSVAGGSDSAALMLSHWEDYRNEIKSMEDHMGRLSRKFLDCSAWEDAAKCAMKADAMKFIADRMPSLDRVLGEMLKAQRAQRSDLDEPLMRQLMNTSSRLGIATHDAGVEGYAANLPSNLAAICRAVDKLLDCA